MLNKQTHSRCLCTEPAKKLVRGDHYGDQGYLREIKSTFGPAGILLSSPSGDYSPAESTADWLRGNLGIFSSRKWVSLQKDILFTCRSHLRHYQRLWFVFLWPDGFVSDVPASIIKLLQNRISIFFLFSHFVITSCRWLCFLASVLALEFCCILLSL